MTENELALINIIRSSEHPEQAILTAIEVFTAFLTQPGEDPAQHPACLSESS